MEINKEFYEEALIDYEVNREKPYVHICISSSIFSKAWDSKYLSKKIVNHAKIFVNTKIIKDFSVVNLPPNYISSKEPLFKENKNSSNEENIKVRLQFLHYMVKEYDWQNNKYFMKKEQILEILLPYKENVENCAVGSFGTCLYLTEDGKKCAVGKMLKEGAWQKAIMHVVS